MGDAHGGIGLVDVLAASSRRPVGIDAQVRLADLDVHILHLRQDGDGGRGGVDAAPGLGLGHPLNPVDAALELQPAEDALAGDRGDDLLVAADLALGDGVNLHPPAVEGGVALVHAEQVAGEERRLVAAGPGPDLEDGRGVLVPVPGRKQERDLAFKRRQAGLQGLQLVPGEGGHVRVARDSHFLQFRRLRPCLLQGADRFDHRLQFGVLP